MLIQLLTITLLSTGYLCTIDPATPDEGVIIIGNEIPNPFPFPTHYRSDIEAGLHLKCMDSVVQANF